MTDEEHALSHFESIAAQTEPVCHVSGQTLPVKDEDIQKSIREAIADLAKEKKKEGRKRIVKFAGQKIEYESPHSFHCRIKGSSQDSESLDKLVQSFESKKSITVTDKSSYDWEQYKEEKGIKEEVENAKKDGYTLSLCPNLGILKNKNFYIVWIRDSLRKRGSRENERGYAVRMNGGSINSKVCLLNYWVALVFVLKRFSQFSS